MGATGCFVIVLMGLLVFLGNVNVIFRGAWVFGALQGGAFGGFRWAWEGLFTKRQRGCILESPSGFETYWEVFWERWDFWRVV